VCTQCTSTVPGSKIKLYNVICMHVFITVCCTCSNCKVCILIKFESHGCIQTLIIGWNNSLKCITTMGSCSNPSQIIYYMYSQEVIVHYQLSHALVDSLKCRCSSCLGFCLPLPPQMQPGSECSVLHGFGTLWFINY
jgi:hypothetical protein